jgi:dTMP kinase
MTRGRFITFEGGEGAGKSTQVTVLAASLRGAGLEVVETREPGGSPGAEEIRDLLIHGDTARWDAESEALLHFAARRDHLTKTVWPALQAGRWVICDRFADSTFAYQGYGQGLPLDDLRALYRIAVGDFQPDLTLLLDLPVASGLARAERRKDGGRRYETMAEDFHERLRQGFRDLATTEPERFEVIDASVSEAEVAAAVRRVVAARLDIAL